METNIFNTENEEESNVQEIVPDIKQDIIKNKVIENSTEAEVDIESLSQHPLQLKYYGETGVNAALAESIKISGLIDLPVINQNNQIIIGNRRIEAIKSLNVKKIRVRVLNPDMADLEEAFIVESNLQRDKSLMQKVLEVKYLYQKYSNRVGRPTIDNERPEGRTRDLVYEDTGICGTYADWLAGLDVTETKVIKILKQVDDG